MAWVSSLTHIFIRTLMLCLYGCVDMSYRLTVMTGLLIGVAEESATLLTTMVVSLQLITLLLSTLMCALPWTLSLLCGTGPKQPGGGGPHSSTVQQLQHSQCHTTRTHTLLLL